MAMGLASQCDIELMPQIEVLDFQAARRPEPVGDECDKQLN